LRIIFLHQWDRLFVTCVTFFFYEFIYSVNIRRKTFYHWKNNLAPTVQQRLLLTTLMMRKKFWQQLKTEPHIVAASLYDKAGNLFTQ